MDRLKSLMDALRKLATDPSSMSTSVCVPQTRQSRTTYIPTRARRGKAFGETVKPVRAASPGRLALEGRRAQAYTGEHEYAAQASSQPSIRSPPMDGERPIALRDEADQRVCGLKAYWPGRHRLRDRLVPDRWRRGTELARPRKQNSCPRSTTARQRRCRAFWRGGR